MAAAVAFLGLGQAIAEQSDSAAAAEQLFTQGRQLMAQGDLASACPKFAASMELDPALGTQLNLAHCYEKQGKLASAWAQYREAADRAKRDAQDERYTFARSRADALEPRLSQLAIEVFKKVPGMVVTRGDVPVDPALWGTMIYVDPGEHQVRASAPGYQPFTTTVTVNEAEKESMIVRALQPESQPRDSAAQEEESSQETADPMALDVPETRSRTFGTRRIVGLATGGVGVSALAVGLGVGWSARSTWNDAFDSGLCDRDTRVCTQDGQEQTDSARQRAWASNILIGAGVALVGTGVYLYLTAPDRQKEERGLAITPLAGPQEVGIAVSGGF